MKLGVVVPARLPRPTPVKSSSNPTTKAKAKGSRSNEARHNSPTAFPVTGVRRRQAFVGKFYWYQAWALIAISRVNLL